MGAFLYDKALLDKLQRWTDRTNMTVVDPDSAEQLFSMIADKTNDKPIQLPLIAITRPNGYAVNILGKRWTTHSGINIQSTTDKSLVLNNIPITIEYRLDVYTRYQREADEYARNLVFNIINFPKITVEIPYEGTKFTHNSNIRITGGVENTSDTAQRIVPGQFTRYSIGIDIDDAFLWDVREKNNISIVPEIELKN